MQERDVSAAGCQALHPNNGECGVPRLWAHRDKSGCGPGSSIVVPSAGLVHSAQAANLGLGRRTGYAPTAGRKDRWRLPPALVCPDQTIAHDRWTNCTSCDWSGGFSRGASNV